jgi:hypothetical protein
MHRPGPVLPRPPVVADVAAALAVAVDEASAEQGVPVRERHFDARAVVVLAEVSALEVMGEKARIQPDARKLAVVGQSALGAQGGKGENQSL